MIRKLKKSKMKGKKCLTIVTETECEGNQLDSFLSLLGNV